MKKLVRLIVLVLSFTLVTPAISNARSLDSAKWQKMSEKYDYPPPVPPDKKPEKKEKEEKTDTKKEKKKNSNPFSFFNGSKLPSVLLYAGIAVLFGLLIVVLIRADVIKIGKGRSPELKTTYDVENPEELVLTELQRELQEAEANNNYNRCLRYEFLLLLEKLQSLGRIRWHKYNTNGDYLNQLINYKLHKRIRTVTVIYEYYWYGEHTLSLEDYTKLSIVFEQLRMEVGNE